MTEGLKKCPFCGDYEIRLERVSNPLVFWDSNVRGEYCYAVICENCGAIVKGNSPMEAMNKWNKRENE